MDTVARNRGPKGCCRRLTWQILGGFDCCRQGAVVAVPSPLPTLQTFKVGVPVPSAGAAPYNSFKRVTNPHMFELGGVLVLGTSGQTVDDMAKYTRRQNR